MALSQSWPGVSGKAQAIDVRNDLAGAVMRPGVFANVNDPVVPLMNKTNTMIPTVREFHAALRRANVQDGIQLVWNNGPTGTFPQFDAAPQTGSRMDLLILRVFDTTYDSKASVEFDKITGTATTGTAVARRDLMPTNAIELGTVLIPAGATSLNSSGVIYTDTFQFAALRGSPVPFRSETEMTEADAGLHAIGAEGYIVGTGDRYRTRAKSGSATGKAWYGYGQKGTGSGSASQIVGSNYYPAALSLPSGSANLTDTQSVTLTVGRLVRVRHRLNFLSTGNCACNYRSLINGVVPSASNPENMYNDRVHSQGYAGILLGIIEYYVWLEAGTNKIDGMVYMDSGSAGATKVWAQTVIFNG